MVIVYSNQRTGFTPYNLYVIDVDCGNRNCYNCRGFGHLARNCRNKGTEGRIGEERRLEYKNNGQRLMIEGNRQNNSNLNGNRDLVVLN